MGFLSNIFKGVPGLGSISNILERPGDIMNKPLQTLLPLGLDALSIGGLPGIGGPLAQFAKGAGKFAPFLSLLGGSGGFGGLNSLTDPLGFKLGPGGPYADRGLGDKQLGVADKLEKWGSDTLGQTNQIPSMADSFRLAGNNFLSQGQGLPDLASMGMLSNTPNIMGNLANFAGVPDPFTGQGGAKSPYELFGHQQDQFNQTADMMNQGRQRGKSEMRAQMAAQGINDPRALAAAEARMNTGVDQGIAGEHARMGNEAFGTRMNTLQSFLPLAQNLYGAQFGQQQANIGNAGRFLGMGADLYGQNTNNAFRGLGAAGDIYGQGAQRAMNMQNDAHNSAGSLAGLGFGTAGQGGNDPFSGFLQHLFNPNTWKTGGSQPTTGKMPNSLPGMSYPNPKTGDEWPDWLR